MPQLQAGESVSYSKFRRSADGIEYVGVEAYNFVNGCVEEVYFRADQMEWLARQIVAGGKRGVLRK